MQNWNQYMNLFLESVREVCVYRNLDHTTFMTYQREQNFLFKSVQIPTELFCNLLIQYFPKKQVQRVKKQFLEQVAKTAITQDMYRVLNEIENAMTALVGPSGGGKSTIASMLTRFWDVKEGGVRIRGVDIRNIQLSELMNEISMVFQRVYLFQDTIYNNISMGKPNATKEEVYEAAKKARCYDFIMKLPNGFNTVVGEGGTTLSGGEKQRISIARCILKDAPIVILDEETASVDMDNESYIQEAINELVKGKTLLVIAHRLNTIQSANQIIVVNDGKIAQIGTHVELMKTGGIYRDFVDIRQRTCAWMV